MPTARSLMFRVSTSHHSRRAPLPEVLPLRAAWVASGRQGHNWVTCRPCVPTAGSEHASQAKLVIFAGHDNNVMPVRAILGFDGDLPEGLPNDPQPGGLLMFERLRAVKTGERFVRVSYHAQTLDQLRYLSVLDDGSPTSVPFRADFKPPASWGAQDAHLIPIARYRTMIQAVAEEAWR